MRLQKWSIIITIAALVAMACSAYYRTMAEAQPSLRADEAVGFQLLETDSGGRFFTVLMQDQSGKLRVDVYDSKGAKSGTIPLGGPAGETPPVRILPE